MNWLAPAKINLSLRVLGRRPDGYHALETLMVPLDLADEIALVPTETAVGDIELTCSDPTLPTGADNLAWRAAALFRSHRPDPVQALRIVLQKHIPHGAGLGGGSSDAATVLLALNERCDDRLALSELAAFAGELGSDVPFFLYRSAALCRGRGEIVEPVPFATSIPLLLLKPPFPVPTPWAYQHWASARELPGVRYEAQRLGWGELVNDLERPVFEKYLVLAEMKMWLLDQPEVDGALLSGSGSTMLAVLRRAEDGLSLGARAVAQFGTLWCCSCNTRPNPSVPVA